MSFLLGAVLIGVLALFGGTIIGMGIEVIRGLEL